MSEVEWAKLAYPDVESLDREKTVVILPIGSMEVHGPHLPLGQDTLVVHRVAVEAARKSPPALVLPPLYYAYVPENRHFPGTISLSGVTLLKLLEEICDEVYRNGFKRILILNGHGGNTRLLRLFVREMQERGKRYLLYVWAEPWRAIHGLIERLRETETIGHAGEIETSFSLYLFPQLCRMDRVKRPAKLGPVWVVEGLETMADWICFAVEGYLGDPRAASSEKGEKLFNAWVEKLVEVIEKVRRNELYERVLNEFYSRAGY
ncbi:MAG: hypothetical protein DRJ57_05240 [Thermoprotei archaeon]|nr:MAG: hypothetical protein DRJ57_05240 [Thermoprotei archaeon]